MEPEVSVDMLDPSDRNTIHKIAQLYFDEWGTPIEETVERLTSQPDSNTLFQLIVMADDEVVATGGLCNEVNIYRVHPDLRKYRPWVALLYTSRKFRNKGFGSLLLQQIELKAKEMGSQKIYLCTFTAESLYRRHGWTEIERVLYKGHDSAIMEKKLFQNYHSRNR